MQESLPPEKKGGVFRVVSATTCFAVPPVGRGACSRAGFHLSHSLVRAHAWDWDNSIGYLGLLPSRFFFFFFFAETSTVVAAKGLNNNSWGMRAIAAIFCTFKIALKFPFATSS